MLTGSLPCSGWAPYWGTCDLTGLSAVTGVAIAAATEVLWALSGRQFGYCELTIRPCRSDCLDFNWNYINDWWQWGVWPRPLFYQGIWTNLTCGGCTRGCSCSVVSEAILPSPVSQIVQVKVDGVVLDSTQYRVDDGRRLVRLGGSSWPICNDLTKADTQTGTWSVKLQFGSQVPELGRMALGELACQFAQLLGSTGKCKLPIPVQSIVRQGVTMNFIDPTQILEAGRVGLYVSDMFIRTFNPAGLASRNAVYDIDGDDYTITG